MASPTIGRFDGQSLCAGDEGDEQKKNVGGKANIRNEVMIRAGSRIIDGVRRAVENLSGPERIVTAITVPLAEMRSNPLGQLMLKSIRAQEMTWLKDSALVAGFATELTGLTDDDEQAAYWIVRVVMSLMYWPADDAETERQIVQRFVAPAFRPDSKTKVVRPARSRRKSSWCPLSRVL